jgi:hypothetical protein
MTPSNRYHAPELATSVTIIILRYRARCTEPGRRKLGRVIQRHAAQLPSKWSLTFARRLPDKL